MNKLQTEFDGGFPFALDDLRFMQSANRTALASLARSLFNYSGKEVPVIIYGAQISNNGTDTVSISEGALYYNAEIWHIPAHSFTAPLPLTESPLWNLELTYDPNGDKIFYDGEMHRTYEIRNAKAAMAASSSAVETVYWENTIRLDGMNTKRAFLQPNTAASVSERADRAVRSRVVNERGIIHVDAGFTFNVNISAGNPWVVLATLPVGYRPLSYVEWFAPATTLYQPNTPNVIFCARIDVDGAIRVKYQNPDDGNLYQGVLHITINTIFNINS